MDKVSIYAWTDSQVTLHWIQGHSSRWKPFVANRVLPIQTNLSGVSWHHVPITSNPADLVNRGIDTADLQTSYLWWHGLCWLNSDEASRSTPPSTRSHIDNVETELRKISTVLVVQLPLLDCLIDKFSRFLL